MQIRIADDIRVSCDLLGIAVHDDNFTGSAFTDERLLDLDKSLDGLLRRTIADERFRGSAGQLLGLHSPQLPSRRICLIGLGSRQSAQSPATMQNPAAQFVRYSMSVGAQTIAFAGVSPLPADSLPSWIAACAFGLELGLYRFDKYLTSEKRPSPLPTAAYLVDPGTALLAPDVANECVTRGVRVARGMSFARDLVNEPAGYLTPTTLAELTVNRALSAGATAQVLSRQECADLGMGLFLAVAQGAESEPKFVHLTWKPDPTTGAARLPRVVLVGKGVTFDSGGLSLKTTEGMLDMKTDMAGAAAVLSALAVIAEEKLPVEVHALAACTENMLSARSYKLGDVLKSMAGKTVEINNTDAEGRLTLADALTYGLRLQPDVILDFATLTGACIVALGPHTAGVMTNHEGTRQLWLAAASAAGEDMWPLPLPPRLADQLKSDVADMKNTGERWGGALTAGHFLKEFVGQTPWIHVDLAGPSTSSKDWGTAVKGGTGFGVPTIVEYIRRLAQSPTS